MLRLVVSRCWLRAFPLASSHPPEESAQTSALDLATIKMDPSRPTLRFSSRGGDITVTAAPGRRELQAGVWRSDTGSEIAIAPDRRTNMPPQSNVTCSAQYLAGPASPKWSCNSQEVSAVWAAGDPGLACSGQVIASAGGSLGANFPCD